MTGAKSDGDAGRCERFGREARRRSTELRVEGARVVARAKLHLLATMRASSRCAPWRSGRTIKDLERRSGLTGLPSPERAPLLAPLLELLIADGLVTRRAGHYRLAAACASRCPSCGSTEFLRIASPDPPDDALGCAMRFVCAKCDAWCGPALDPPGPPPAPDDRHGGRE